MPAPCLDIQHLKTSKQYIGTSLIMRYWFQWQNRRNLSAVVVRLELLDTDGKKVTEASVKLPKVKITGYVPANETSPEKPIYDSPVFIKIDDIDREELPVLFRYWTVTGVFNKSDNIERAMDGIFEDISMHG